MVRLERHPGRGVRNPSMSTFATSRLLQPQTPIFYLAMHLTITCSFSSAEQCVKTKPPAHQASSGNKRRIFRIASPEREPLKTESWQASYNHRGTPRHCNSSNWARCKFAFMAHIGISSGKQQSMANQDPPRATTSRRLPPH